jgi:cytochrome P450
VSLPADPVPLFSPEMNANPYPLYHRLRSIDPVYWSERHQAWIVTSYDAVAAGLVDLRLSSDRARLFQQLAGTAEFEPFFSFVSKRMVYNDPPAHDRLRGIVSKAFTPHVIDAMRPHIQQLVDGFLNAVVAARRLDLIADLALPLPVIVVSEMLGVPAEDRDLVHRWSDKIVAFFSTHPAHVTALQYRMAQQSMRDVSAYLKDALPRIRREGRQCLLLTMTEAEHDGEQLSEEELFANANIFLVAGEYVTHLIGNGMLALLNHAEQLRQLETDPALIPGAVEEFLRCVGPLQFTHRIAREDLILGGKTIRCGQLVFLFLAAANRDPAHFPDPDAIDVTRPVHKHLSLGLGPHFCLGAPLARLEAQIAFEIILRRLMNPRLASEQVEYRDNFNVRGLRSLQVTFD